MAFGWNATAYQILNIGVEHWIDEAIPAVVGYVKRGGYLLAAGAPICPEAMLPHAVRAFESFAATQSCGVCFVLAEERLRRMTEAWPDHSVVTIGAQPAWNPAEWPAIVQARSSLRAQLHRARNKGVEIAAMTSSDPGIRETLDAWIESRGLPPMHFLVEPHILGDGGADRILLAARRGGRMIAFLAASPVPLRRGFLIELVARAPGAPNGTSELLIDAAMHRLAECGAAYVTLGLVALATCADHAMQSDPWWLRGMVAIARAHANRFYNFRGLEQFRTKMAPQRWETIYVVSNRKRFSPFALYAMGGAFSGISPLVAISLGILKAARQQVRRLANNSRKTS